jgi:hypothetical protein
MWGKKSARKYESYRQEWLGGEAIEAIGSELAPDAVLAVMMELRVCKGAASLVGAHDGTASLYLENGGGITGMGLHAPTAAASLALVGSARSYLETIPIVSDFALPAKGMKALRIITKAGIHSEELTDTELSEDLPIAPLAIAAEHLLTNARFLDERNKRSGIRPHKVYVHIFADGGVCLLVPPLATGTWLTPMDLKRVLEIARSHDDRLQIFVESGNAELQAAVQEVVAGSGLARDPGVAERLLGYSGGTTTLLNAVADARLDLVEDLLKRGVDLEAQDVRGYTGLILAAYRGRIPILRLLVQAGANVNARDHHGNSVLLFAAQHGDLQTVKLLVEAGTDLNLRGQNGYTALKVAKLTSRSDVVAFLESNGAKE